MGRHILQPFWERLNRLSLYGMNIGEGSDISDSGELWVIDYFSKHLLSDNNPIVVFDVGANVGRYGQAIVSRFGKRVKLYCFEPSKKTFELLVHNLSTNDNVELFNFGFGDKEECVTLYSDVEGSGLGSIYERRLIHFNISMSYREEIRLSTLENFCMETDLKHINFLKLDVEGNEFKALNGAKNLIVTNSIDFIQFEFGGCNIDSRTYFQDFFYLLNQYYKIYRILKDGLAPIETYKETYENFITTNYLAISRSYSF